MPGLRGEAAIVGLVELAPTRKPLEPRRFTIEQWATLAGAAIVDAGIDPARINGLVTTRLAESPKFAPATVAEYLGITVSFAETIDIGGANAAGMVWRAAAAVELGICDVVLLMVPGATGSLPQSSRRAAKSPDYFGASSNEFGSPQAEFEIPYGILGQNLPYAQIAHRYAAVYGYDAAAIAKIAVDQRTNACSTPNAVFYGSPITVDDVLASPMIADPIHRLEAVMSCQGGAGVIVASADVARAGRHRPVWITGFGEQLSFKTPTYAPDLLNSPVQAAAQSAFRMAGLTPSQVDVASIYDCYTITVLMSLEDAGFCPKGTGMQFVANHDLTFRGDFPLNTSGGQLSFGQAGMAGGMHHVCDATRQLMGRSGDTQLADCNRAFVSGNGGIMSEQVALLLQGD
jgi:acetyl-CoA C-acetyltransferase